MNIRILTGLLLMLSLLSLNNYSIGEASPIAVTAKSAIVIEAETGRVIMEKNADSRAFPASTTKMVTGILAMESGRLDDVVTVSKNAAETDGSSIWLEAGEQLTLEQLCYGLLLHSGNDAANAIAEYLGGAEKNFVAQMNELAFKVGAAHTHFANANGLPNPNHYTTARDLSRIAAYGLRNQIFQKIVSTDHAIIPWGNKPYQRELFNTNHLLTSFPGANGVKTGYTDAAGPCLVASARRNGLEVIAVVLDSDDLWNDASALLQYGFSSLSPDNYFVAGQPLAEVPLMFGNKKGVSVGTNQTLVLPVPERSEDYRYTVAGPKALVYPPEQGAVAGSVSVYYKDTLIEELPLYYLDRPEPASLFQTVARLFQTTRNRLAHAVDRLLPAKSHDAV